MKCLLNTFLPWIFLSFMQENRMSGSSQTRDSSKHALREISFPSCVSLCPSLRLLSEISVPPCVSLCPLVSLSVPPCVSSPVSFPVTISLSFCLSVLSRYHCPSVSQLTETERDKAGDAGRQQETRGDKRHGEETGRHSFLNPL